jgi:hypothetical protein
MSTVPSSINIAFRHEDDQDSIYSEIDSESIRQLKVSNPLKESPYLKYSLAPWPQECTCNKKPRFDHDRGYNISPLRNDNRNRIRNYYDGDERQIIRNWIKERNEWEIQRSNESMTII